MEPYLVTVFLTPSKKEADEGVAPKLVVKADTVLAKDVGDATSKAYRLVPVGYEDIESRLEVRVLPFQRVNK